jgi:adenylate kinase
VANYHVVYLTGAPACGKTTLAKQLQTHVQPLQVYHYSALLTEHINKTRSLDLDERDLKMQSGSVITLEAVQTVDDLLIKAVQERRKSSHILIDSHAVTKEDYGYRITSFSYDKLLALQPSLMCMLYVEASETIRRITKSSGGRPMVTAFQADYHTFLQSQVAIAYSLSLGQPLYVFDATESIARATEKLSELLST